MIYKVPLPSNVLKPKYKNLVLMDIWCRENCTDDWEYDKNQYGSIQLSTYCFNNGEDAMAFKLRWI